MKAIAFQTRLESDTVHLLNAEAMIGKEVIITVVEVEPEPKGKEWKFIGTENMKGSLDEINIRDLAHE